MDSKKITRDQINSLIPQSPPFLFLNNVTNYSDSKLSADYIFNEQDDFFRGHFPTEPIVPGVLLCECCLQAGAVFMSLNQQKKIEGKAIVTKMDKVKFKNFATPNMNLNIEVAVIEKINNFVLMSGKISNNSNLIMSLEFMVGII